MLNLTGTSNNLFETNLLEKITSLHVCWDQD